MISNVCQWHGGRCTSFCEPQEENVNGMKISDNLQRFG